MLANQRQLNNWVKLGGGCRVQHTQHGFALYERFRSRRAQNQPKVAKLCVLFQFVPPQPEGQGWTMHLWHQSQDLRLPRSN